jgi:hypothetical protein
MIEQCFISANQQREAHKNRESYFAPHLTRANVFLSRAGTAADEK